MLKQHEYYVYHDGKTVYARMEGQKPVVAETLKTPQEAHDKVQEIINPRGRKPEEFGPRGFLEPSFQAAISGHAEQYVKEAYGASTKKGKSKA